MNALDELSRAIGDYDNASAAKWTAAALAAGVKPSEALSAVADTMAEIGEGFGSGELWLPDLIAAAEAARAGLDVIEERIVQTGEQAPRVGTVVLGTVAGDLHSIGKSMVGAFLTATGYRVIDLGINVPRDRFVAAVKQHRAGLVAMSALLTTTMQEQQRVLDALAKAGLREQVKVMVGGGAITPEFARRIGADGYGATAPEAARLARTLMGR